jgi:hypothetical protein
MGRTDSQNLAHKEGLALTGTTHSLRSESVPPALPRVDLSKSRLERHYRAYPTIVAILECDLRYRGTCACHWHLNRCPVPVPQTTRGSLKNRKYFVCFNGIFARLAQGGCPETLSIERKV